MSGASTVSRQARENVLGKHHKKTKKSLPPKKELPKDRGFVTAHDIVQQPARVSLEPNNDDRNKPPIKPARTRDGPALCRREVCKALELDSSSSDSEFEF